MLSKGKKIKDTQSSKYSQLREERQNVWEKEGMRKKESRIGGWWRVKEYRKEKEEHWYTEESKVNENLWMGLFWRGLQSGRGQCGAPEAGCWTQTASLWMDPPVVRGKTRRETDMFLSFLQTNTYTKHVSNANVASTQGQISILYPHCDMRLDIVFDFKYCNILSCLDSKVILWTYSSRLF